MKTLVKTEAEKPKPRGRPRSEKAKLAILRAAQGLLEEGGPGAVTMEAVALRAGVGKPTIYRWWPDKHAVAMAALMETEETEGDIRASRRTALNTLKQQLRSITKRFATKTGRHIATMIAASDTDSELSKAFRNHFVMARRTEGKALLEQAVHNSEIRRNLDIEVTLDLLYGPLFFRLLMGHADLNEDFTDQLLNHIVHGIHS
jgi:AcrR family transcriptional regulator